MSHWILEPVVVRTRDGAEVLSMEGSAWDGGGVPPTFPAADRVELHLRHYPDGSTTYDMTVDVETERCWLSDAEDESVPATEALGLLTGPRERVVQAGAEALLAQGFCPDCQAKLYPSWLDRLRGRPVTCLVCGRTWKLPSAP